MGVPRYTPERTKSLKKEKKRKKIPTDITTLLTDFPRPLNHQLSGIAWGQRKTIMQLIILLESWSVVLAQQRSPKWQPIQIFSRDGVI